MLRDVEEAMEPSVGGERVVRVKECGFISGG